MSREVEALRQQPGWREFHQACAAQQLFFDHIEKEGRRFVAQTIMGSGHARLAAEESGATPLEALVNSYRAAKIRVAAAEPHLELLLNPRPAIATATSDFDDLLGGNEIEDLLG